MTGSGAASSPGLGADDGGSFAPRLRELARRPVDEVAAADGAAPDEAAEPTAAPEADQGACDLCSEPIGARHGHVVDLSERTLLCACRPCSILFDDEEAGGDRYRLVPERVRLLEAFELSEMDWVALRIPVDLAFFFHSSPAGRVMALYPGPMGATESQLSLEHWEKIEEHNPVLAEMEPDVQALLVDRTGESDDGWIVPIDVCYELVGLFRTRWKGLSGGSAVWEGVDEFFEELRRRAGAS